MTAVLSELDLGAQVNVRATKSPVRVSGPVEGVWGNREVPPGDLRRARRTVSALPGEPNTVLGDAIWLGPDEWLVLGAHEEDYPGAAAAVDVSANRVGFALSGPGAADVLAQGCSLDLHASAFPPGRCAQTLVARAQVILLRPDAETFHLLVRPSFAPYLRAWLEDAL